jgi:hypothetical protein
MATIPESLLKKLREAGLFVSRPYSPTHGWPDGVRVGKPMAIPGNCIPGYEPGYAVMGDAPVPPDMDAPMVVLFSPVPGTWVVYAVDGAGGLLSGDFINEWHSPEEAVQDVLAFYFGDPIRMLAKAKARKHPVISPDSDTGSKRASA